MAHRQHLQYLKAQAAASVERPLAEVVLKAKPYVVVLSVPFRDRSDLMPDVACRIKPGCMQIINRRFALSPEFCFVNRSNIVFEDAWHVNWLGLCMLPTSQELNGDVVRR